MRELNESQKHDIRMYGVTKQNYASGWKVALHSALRVLPW